MSAPVYWIGCLIIALTVLALPMPLLAIPLSPVVHETIEQQQKMRLEQTQKQREALQSVEPLSTSIPDVPQSDKNASCFVIKRIELSGITVLTSSTLKKLTRIPDEGCLRLTDIQQRVNDITQIYISMGYITSRAWLPEQDISSTVLHINVTEGRVESITIDGQKKLDLQMAFPGVSGQLLNLRDIEQGIEQLNRLSSRPLTVDIIPGDVPGYSRLQLIPAYQHFPLTLNVGIDNNGQKSTGEQQISASVVADNILHIADQWAFTIARDAEFHTERRSRSVQASISVPYGYWLFSAQYGWSDSWQPVTSSNWRYEGSVQTQRLSVNRTLWRDGNQRLVFETDLTRRKTENCLGDVRLTVSSPTITSLTSGFSYSRTLGKSYLTLGPAFSQGLEIAGATNNDAYRGLPASDFRRFTLNGSWFYPITSSFSWLTTIYGQATPNTLYASEQLSVGGLYSVRGFKEQYLSGNRGGYLRNELTWLEDSMTNMGTLSVTGALDTGYVVRQKGKVDGGTVTGAALGLTLSSGWGSQTITIGTPLAWPHSLNPDNTVVYWQATLAL